MSDATTVTAMTNTTPNSCVEVRCDCATMWSLAQQFCYVRLSEPVARDTYRFVKHPAVRARRIAATYARFYLELEDGGKPQWKGRFYWMALGAFASKTVACSLEMVRVNMLSTVRDRLAMGNLWLFGDIAGWHWHYCRFPESFRLCRDARDTRQLVTAVKDQLAKLPWQDKALPIIRHLQVSEHIRKGFDKVQEFEREEDPLVRPTIQMEHLLAIAHHEQGVILQPLIYDDPDFAFWVRAQRTPPASWFSPGLQLVFTSACETDDAALKSVAPKGTRLEDFRSRMQWIQLAAELFHKRMQEYPQEMHRELEVMAAWVSMADR
ncbi:MULTISPECIES: hypothetical protein [Caldimonas]|uniref:DUF2515 family protein n=1 Tax=Caldimonas TaxID=196013 RepID=UPI000475E270|nr:hypothetical protein [Caldimonas manganoxidans]